MNGLAWAAVAVAAWFAIAIPAAVLVGRWLRRNRQAAEDQAIAITKPPVPGPHIPPSEDAAKAARVTPFPRDPAPGPDGGGDR
jgi:hypothetical protein